MAEDLTEYYSELGIRVKYLHSDIDTLDRVEILRELRLGTFDVLIGINLLREGLDLPEVSLVAILDADKEGFLRSEKSLIQTFGRAARNVNGRVILYADRMTEAIDQAVFETHRRKRIQEEYNRVHHITPQTVKKSIRNILTSVYEADYFTVPTVSDGREPYGAAKDIPGLIEKMKKEMKEAAVRLEFERAADLRDQIKRLEERHLQMG
jgi:excinuclease ABC subunit B